MRPTRALPILPTIGSLRAPAVRIALLLPGLLLAIPALASASDGAIPPAAGEDVEPVWVRFVDKGLATPAAERAAIEAAAERLTPRARARRAKVRGARIADLLDVPLPAAAVDAVLATGARLRTRSKWLNAVSVDADPAQRAAIEALPFVESVTPVARRQWAPEPVVPVSGAGGEPAGPTGRALNYGECSSQILPIQVDELHDLGLSGAGVIVALMDTGFKRSHDALLGVDVVAEWDFINDDGVTEDETGDPWGQHNHGTYVLSLIGGNDPGSLIGPAYGASYALAKTEDVDDETPVEEDYWVEAAQWADSLGADVISTSLSYKDWYDYSDMDGNTAPITLAADLAAANGIAVFASAGNEGNGSWFYVAAPADGDSVITVGAVDSTNVIADFSSHGPTFDGRTKPDVCAMGVGTLVALPYDDSGYGRGNGTSFSCPLTAGAGALLLEAHPAWTPMQLREALRETATNAASPDNHRGWGVIQAADAHGYATDAPEIAGVDAPAGLRLHVSPNPTAAVSRIRWELPASVASGRLAIVDVAGRRVRDLGPVGGVAGAEAGGRSGAVAWDGRDEGGRRVASGIWFARLETSAGVTAARVVRLRR
jgi:subtilisin family serine protease